MTRALHRRARRNLWVVNRQTASSAWVNDEDFEILETGVLDDVLFESSRPAQRIVH